MFAQFFFQRRCYSRLAVVIGPLIVIEILRIEKDFIRTSQV